MILETVRIIADWLTDETHGVNAVRLTVPKDTGVSDFPAVTVLDSTRNGAVARGGVPNLSANQFPALLVTPADQSIDSQSPAAGLLPSDSSVTVLIRYVTSTLDTAKAERDASQTLRAVSRSLRLLFTTANSETARTRASVQIVEPRDQRLTTLYESNDDTVVTGGVLVTYRARDLWAQGA